MRRISMKKRTSSKSIKLGLIILIGLIIYAYAFFITDVNFEAVRDETRLESLARILRALAHPNIIEYEQEVLDVEIPFYLPCPEDEMPAYEPDTSEPYLVLEKNCGEPYHILTIEGYNLIPNGTGPINFIAAPSGAKIGIDVEDLSTDSKGYFSGEIELPNRQPVEEAQVIRATVRRNVGLPHFSDMAKVTWDNILETIFLALLATTFGILIAIPVSFFAARNLMADVKSALASIALSVIGWLVGIALGGWAVRLIGSILSNTLENMFIVYAGVVALPLIIWFAIRWVFTKDEMDSSSLILKIARGFILLLAAVLGVIFLFFLSEFLTTIGNDIQKTITALPFVGHFIYQIGDIIQMFTPVIIALVGGGALGSFGGRIGQEFSDKNSVSLVKLVNGILAAVAGAMLFVLISAGIDWFYEIGLIETWYLPAGIGAMLGIALSMILSPKEPLALGSVIYFVTRTILNGTRSVEPLVMVIVFVVWVGIGPFAGALALGLHTVAALAKLFSEQVESIMPGPLEAIRATGANQLQTIVYAVIPQIIPPYISFTMYRWDINVRMSTIIGFAGGGGIGFLLQQNIRLLHYRDASAQMFAIAITVASMDYISSVIRERFV